MGDFYLTWGLLGHGLGLGLGPGLDNHLCFSLPQCISAVAFVKNETDILEQPCWVMLINIVAMDMLKSKIPPGEMK